LFYTRCLEVIYVSEVFEAITGMIQVIADNPASILIVLGFVAVVMAVLLPLGLGAQILFAALGVIMLFGGIILHAVWLGR
jgi:hypothetical protein